MFWKKKKKDANDYYKNELMRSRMSDISIRTDEIIQQYFFVAKEDTLTLDEYLNIRELATKELGFANIPTQESGEAKIIHNEPCVEIEKPKTDTRSKSETDLFYPEVAKAEPTVKHALEIKREAIAERESEESLKEASLPFDDKMRSESRSEPHRTPKKEEGQFDFLAMLQSVED